MHDEGKQEADNDDEYEDGDVNGAGPSIDEEQLIEEKSTYEKSLIRAHRSLFSETLSPDRYLRCPPMSINLEFHLSNELDPLIYRFKPCNTPVHIQSKAIKLINILVSQGIICRLKPNEN